MHGLSAVCKGGTAHSREVEEAAVAEACSQLLADCYCLLSCTVQGLTRRMVLDEQQLQHLMPAMRRKVQLSAAASVTSGSSYGPRSKHAWFEPAVCMGSSADSREVKEAAVAVTVCLVTPGIGCQALLSRIAVEEFVRQAAVNRRVNEASRPAAAAQQHSAHRK